MAESRPPAAAREALRQLASSNTPICGNCRFGSTDGVPEGQILCRRYPPNMVVAQVLGQPIAPNARTGQPGGIIYSTQGVVGHFPVMDPATGWCGEYQRRVEILN